MRLISDRPGGIGRWCLALALRVGRVAVLTIMLWALAQLAMRPARAEMDGKLHQFGQSLLDRAASLTGDRTWLINGARVRVETGHAATVSDAIDRGIRGCESSEVVRGNQTGGSFAACIRGSGLLNNPAAMIEHIAGGGRIQVEEAGMVRFVYAREAKGGAHAVVLRAEQPLSVTQLFGAGEAPGEDVPGLARPAGLERVFSFRELGRPYAFVVYHDRSRTPGELERDFADSLRASGWRTFERYGVRSPGGERTGEESLMAVRGGQLAVLVVFRRANYSVAGLAVTDRALASSPVRPAEPIDF